MSRPLKALTIRNKFFAVFIAVVLLSALDYGLFLKKSREVALYDSFYSSLISLKSSIIKLDFFLETYAAGTGPAGPLPAAVDDEVRQIDGYVGRMMANPAYQDLVGRKSLLTEDMGAISGDWRAIKKQISLLAGDDSADSAMLIQNAVDTKILILLESADRLTGVVSDGRSDAVGGFTTLALFGIFSLMALFLASVLFFKLRVFDPLRHAAGVAARIADNEPGARFDEHAGGAVGVFSAELNRILDAAGAQRFEAEKIRLGVEDMLIERTGQIVAVRELVSYSGRSLAANDIYSNALSVSIAASGVDAAVLYLDSRDNRTLKLKASAGFDDILNRDYSSIPRGLLNSTRAGVYKRPGEHPLGELSREMEKEGFRAVICLPVEYNNAVAGLLVAAARDKDAVTEDLVPFFETVASSLGVLGGYIGLFIRERSAKRFFESIIHQMPFGVAIFDLDGTCLMLNSLLRTLLGVDPATDIVGRYRIFDDNVLSAAGVVTSIKKSYEGYTTEFIINYNPALIENFDFSGPPRKFRIKSFPLYDAAGEISSLVLLYEDLSDMAGQYTDTGETSL